MDLRFRPDLKPVNKRFLPGALKNQAKSKSKKKAEMELSEKYDALERKWLPRFEALGVISRYGRKTGFCTDEEVELFCAG